MNKLQPRQTIKYVDTDNTVKTGVIASISTIKKLIALSGGGVINFNQVVD